MRNRFVLTYLLLLLFSIQTIGQIKTISITIDDVPNTKKFQTDHYQSVLLNKLDSLDVPFTIFVNEGLVYKTDSIELNKKLLESWCKHEKVTIGNHTYQHSRYSKVGLEAFIKDIEQGEKLIHEYAAQHHKKVRFFRFPYNDLGIDSLQHAQIDSVLKKKKYDITPFTVESSDWMFNAVYEHYIQSNQLLEAKQLGELYVNKTMELLAFYDSMAIQQYGRSIQHIYLCHDNTLNADYLPELINRFQQQKYTIVSLESSLTDLYYSYPDHYYKKWGISWLYRWLGDRKTRLKWMYAEPDLSEIEKLFEELTKK